MKGTADAVSKYNMNKWMAKHERDPEMRAGAITAPEGEK